MSSLTIISEFDMVSIVKDTNQVCVRFTDMNDVLDKITDEIPLKDLLKIYDEETIQEFVSNYVKGLG